MQRTATRTHAHVRALLACSLAAFLAACAEVPTSPSAHVALHKVNREIVPGPGQGLLEVCKQGTTSAVTGTFNFSVSGGGGNLSLTAAGTALVCGPAVRVTAGPVTVTEAGGVGVVTAIQVVPSGAGTVNVGTASAAVTVPLGGNVTVIFTNAPAPPALTGLIEVCKIGTTSAVTGAFSFAVSGGGGTVSVTAAGTALICGPAVPVAAGTQTVTEAVRAGFVLSAITLVPPGAGTSNLGTRTATVTVAAGQIVTIIFTNAPETPPVVVPPGFLKVCKFSTGSPAVTGSFTFNVTGIPGTTSISVPVGLCVFVPAPTGIPAGTIVGIQEVLNPGTELASIVIVPATGPGSGTFNVGTRTATVTIASGVLTEIQFTNRAAPPGFLKVCKFSTPATGPAAVTGSFTFTIGGVPGTTSITVPVGQCVFVPPATGATSGLPAGSVISIVETLNPGTELASIAIVPVSGPGSGTFSVPTRTATVTIASGILTEVQFTNRVTPPPLILLQSCSPGYFKNHLVEGRNLLLTSATIGVTAANLTLVGIPTNTTLLAALDFGGGPGVTGAAQTLLRQAAAAYLNIINTPGLTAAQEAAAILVLTNQVNTALASNSRETILAAANLIAVRNNDANCTLNFPNDNQVD